MTRRTWTPRDPEPDALAVVDNYGEIFIRRAPACPCAEGDVDPWCHWGGVVWFMPADPVIEFSWPEQWDGYGGDRDVVIFELDEDELAELVPDERGPA